MKKIFPLLLILLLGSCAKTEKKIVPQNEYFVIAQKLQSEKIIDLVKIQLEKSSSYKTNYDWDLNSLKLTKSIHNDSIFAITIREKSSNLETSNILCYMFNQDSTIFASYIITMKQFGDSIAEVFFDNPEKAIIFSAKFDLQNNTIAFNGDISTTNKQADCGKLIAECISKSYADNGWDSVALWVMTAVIPEVAIAVALLCAKTVSDKC